MTNTASSFPLWFSLLKEETKGLRREGNPGGELSFVLLSASHLEFRNSAEHGGYMQPVNAHGFRVWKSCVLRDW